MRCEGGARWAVHNLQFRAFSTRLSSMAGPRAVGNRSQLPFSRRKSPILCLAIVWLCLHRYPEPPRPPDGTAAVPCMPKSTHAVLPVPVLADSGIHGALPTSSCAPNHARNASRAIGHVGAHVALQVKRRKGRFCVWLSCGFALMRGFPPFALCGKPARGGGGLSVQKGRCWGGYAVQASPFTYRVCPFRSMPAVYPEHIFLP